MNPSWFLPVALSAIAAVVSIAALIFSIYSWRESTLPILIARIVCDNPGNIACALEIKIENVGNRPATHIRLRVRSSDLRHAIDNAGPAPFLKHVEACFARDAAIPVLAHGQSVKCGFGILRANHKRTWIPQSRLPIIITYFDLKHRKYRSKLELKLSPNTSFSGVGWQKSES